MNAISASDSLLDSDSGTVNNGGEVITIGSTGFGDNRGGFAMPENQGAGAPPSDMENPGGMRNSAPAV